ncbi:hypothetical protein AA18889_0312 [Acetobacter senegalensis DSM 18889]|nr:hypothetical protein AA18889_0312 [Acetobacter senegalensis DSM 18889]
MKDTATLTLRVKRHLLDYVKERAAKNDRSMNGEISAILRELVETKKASGNAGKLTPDASITNE